ncbi:hypothetical protein D8674_003450 [Pyrus ussuriensis x Pyrus communis]|uniref:Uncharacterized protein n=1 Tax=Pyrus ussuriensis x Pyrus communis TaxID=2448454 RepID=A0A5N5FH46_9ROSA|nr:hypothetical protein D8674_003450 [Pyrus ussuriensis x Pyrus communis]
MEKLALPFASTDFSSSLSSSESLASARSFLTRDLCHRCSTKLASALSNRWCSDFSFLLITSTRG